MMISANLAALRSAIESAAHDAGRAASDVRLLAVSKGQTAEAIMTAYRAGQRDFGENRVQEALRKFAPLRETCPGIRLHLIGPLQTNKAAAAVSLFDVIGTLDRPKLAEALAAEMARQGRRPDCLIEVNLGGEAQKAGSAPKDLPGFLALCRDDLRLPVRGLMCIPPQDDDPAPHFRQLHTLCRTHDLPECSMGMSGDFRDAITCGATEVRIGTALFGTRQTANDRV